LPTALCTQQRVTHFFKNKNSLCQVLDPLALGKEQKKLKKTLSSALTWLSAKSFDIFLKIMENHFLK
jgi:hypothetical protein